MAETVGERIRAARILAGQEIGSKFAPLVGLRPEQLSRYEHDKIAPSAETLAKIAAACGVRLEWLVTGQGAVNRVSVPPAATGTDD